MFRLDLFKVFVKGASFPLLKHNHSTLEKIYNARLVENYFESLSIDYY